MLRPLLLPVLKFSCGLAALTALTACGKDPGDIVDPATAIDGVQLFATGDDMADIGLIPGESKLKGGWYVYDDHDSCSNPDVNPANAGDLLNPPPMVGPEPFVFTAYGTTPPPPPAEGGQTNKKGLHFWGNEHRGFSGGMGVQLKDKAVFDLKAAGYVGVRFWAWSKAESQLDVKLSDSVSEGTPGGVDGVCKLNVSPACLDGGTTFSATQGCFNTPLATVSVGPSWKEYRVYFTKTVTDNAATPATEAGPMARGAWGKTDDGADINNTTQPLRMDQVYQFQFQTNGADAFDMWIDNVGFIEPGGPQDTAM
jgi:hypothetical protein